MRRSPQLWSKQSRVVVPTRLRDEIPVPTRLATLPSVSDSCYPDLPPIWNVANEDMRDSLEPVQFEIVTER